MEINENEAKGETIEKAPLTKSKGSKKILGQFLYPILCGLASFMAVFAVVHFTPLHYKLRSDPWAKAVEGLRIAVANGPVEKANVQLSLSEAKLKEFKKIKQKSATSPYLGVIATEMVQNNKAAMRYMDQAKSDGEDIKKLQLVKRLCDSLGEQSKEISGVNAEIVGLHQFASALEDKVTAGQDIESAMKEVEESLSQAMQW